MIVTSLAHGQLVLERFLKYDDCALDSETQAAPGYEKDKKSTLIINRHRIRLWSLCHRGEAYSFPTNLIGQYPTMAEWARLFKPLYKDPTIRKVFHNFNYDGNAFFVYQSLFFPIWDTLYGCHYANANYDRDLKSRANLYGRYIAQTSTVDFSNLEELAEYGESDVIATDEFFQMQIFGVVQRPAVIETINEEGIIVQTKNPMPVLRLRVEHENLRPLDRMVLKYQELPMLRAVMRAEQMGFPINRPQVWAIRNQLRLENQKTLAEIYRSAGEQFKVTSNKQVAKVLTKLNVKGLSKTKKGADSVGGPSMFMVQDQHPVIKQILQYKGREKLLSVYAGEQGLERYMDKDNRIHTTINTLGARTGRTSSSNPNLQNIPAAKDTVGLRRCFQAPKDQYVICLDFSQIEIRTMAILCKDAELCRVLCDPKGDIHQNTADQFHVARSPIAKQINFLMLYGGGPFALSQKLTLEGAPTTPEVAKMYIDRYDQVYDGVARFRKRLLIDHQRYGHCQYLLGRKRYLLNVDWHSKREQHKAETTLSNNINQGSAQDLLKASIIRGDPDCINPDREILKRMKFTREHTLRLRDYAVELDKLRADMKKARCRWVLQVHDETLYFIDKKAAQEIGMRIAEMMTWCPFFEPITSMDVPIVVDGGVGENWAHAKGKEPIFKLEHFGETYGVAA